MAGGAPTPGYYYESISTAKDFPSPHALGSRNWTQGERLLPSVVGEVDGGKRPWRRGFLSIAYPPSVLIGTLDQVQGLGTRLLDPANVIPPENIDRRCYAAVPKATIPPADMLFWHRAADVATQNRFTPIRLWNDGGENGYGLAQPDPTKQPYTDRALLPRQAVAVAFPRGSSMVWNNPPHLGLKHSVYMGLRTGTFGANINWSAAVRPQALTFSRFFWIDQGNLYYSNGPQLFSIPLQTPVANEYLLVWARTQGNLLELGINGQGSQLFFLNPVDITLGSIDSIPDEPGPSTGDPWINEFVGYSRELSDQEQADTLNFLQAVLNQ